MLENEFEVKVVKVVKDPKLSLKRFSQYTIATENGKKRILKGCKYPGDYVPRFYEMARKLICDIFSANFEDHDLYFDEFKRQASIYRNEAKVLQTDKDPYKNRICSANGIDAIVAMSPLITPILSSYTLNSNLTHRKDAITKNGVRIGSMADILLFEDGGATQVGFLKFNFTKKVLSKNEAETALFVLKTFFEKQGIKLNLNSCLLVDVFAWRIYKAFDRSDIESAVDEASLEIRNNWDLI